MMGRSRVVTPAVSGCPWRRLRFSRYNAPDTARLTTTNNDAAAAHGLLIGALSHELRRDRSIPPVAPSILEPLAKPFDELDFVEQIRVAEVELLESPLLVGRQRALQIALDDLVVANIPSVHSL